MVIAKVKQLAAIAMMQPQSAYNAFTHGLFGEWTYLFKRCYIDESQVHPLEDCMRKIFIQSLLGREAVSEIEKDRLSLPTQYGGFRSHNPLSFNVSQHSSLVAITQPLVVLLCSAMNSLSSEIEDEMSQLKNQCVRKEEEYKNMASSVKFQLPLD